jgi:hypothetical protein
MLYHYDKIVPPVVKVTPMHSHGSRGAEGTAAHPDKSEWFCFHKISAQGIYYSCMSRKNNCQQRGKPCIFPPQFKNDFSSLIVICLMTR